MEKLTVIIFSYNHERYLARALDSVLCQVTSFPFRILIADDASSDRSREIIRNYAERHRGCIEAILRPQNLGSMENYRQTLASVRSEYVIVNDGDDWFTDSLKLQRQVDYLDKHRECALCFHPVRIEKEGESAGNDVFPLCKDWKEQSLDELLKRNFMQTNSVMYRWAFNDGTLLHHLPGGIVPGDHFLHLLHAERGRIGFLPEIMAVYLRHPGSVWEGDAKTPSWFLRCAEEHIRFYEELEKRYGVNMHCNIRFMQKHLQLARQGHATILQKIRWYILSKLTCGSYRKMYKSLCRLMRLWPVFYAGNLFYCMASLLV